DVAYCVGKADNEGRNKDQWPTTSEDLDKFKLKFGSEVGAQNLAASCIQAWQAWKGVYRPSNDAKSTHPCGPINSNTNPGQAGRETCILAAPGHQAQYHDCRDEEGNDRSISDVSCTWFDLDCDLSTGVCDASNAPLVDHRFWVGQA